MATKRRLEHANGKQTKTKRRKLNNSKLESDDDEEEDEDGHLLTSKLDKEIQSGLYALRTKDPLIYDREHSFIKNNHNNSKADTKYQWVKQFDDEEQDTFLQQFFSNQLWRCKDEKLLTSIGVHRGYEGTQHNLDEINLSEDDQTIDKQNDFEREWQKKNALESEKEINAQIQKQKHNENSIKAVNKNDNEHKQIQAFLEESD